MTKATITKGKPGSANEPPADAMKRTEAFQLTRLSSVLNGLEGGAAVIRHHLEEAVKAVRAGTYQIDSRQLSRRIIGEALGSA